MVTLTLRALHRLACDVIKDASADRASRKTEAKAKAHHALVAAARHATETLPATLAAAKNDKRRDQIMNAHHALVRSAAASTPETEVLSRYHAKEIRKGTIALLTSGEVAFDAHLVRTACAERLGLATYQPPGRSQARDDVTVRVGEGYEGLILMWTTRHEALDDAGHKTITRTTGHRRIPAMPIPKKCVSREIAPRILIATATPAAAVREVGDTPAVLLTVRGEPKPRFSITSPRDTLDEALADADSIITDDPETEAAAHSAGVPPWPETRTREESPTMPTHEFLWLDLETTGLDPRKGELLEFAAVLCEDAKGDDFAIVERYEGVISARLTDTEIDPYVRGMHERNGLWDAVAASDTPLTEVDEFLAALAARLSGGKKRSIVLAGSSVHFDLAWCRMHLPRFAAYLSHRVFDVSTLRRAVDAWCPGVVWPVRDSHRAMADILATIDEARVARAALTGCAS